MSQPPAMPPPPPWSPGPVPGGPVPGPPPGSLYYAALFDSIDNGRPVVDRPAVPEELRERLVEFLKQAPIVLAARGFDTDRLNGRQDVPLTFHTDGTWVWSGASGYYLKEHGLPPVPGLVAHAQASGFQVPEVSDEVKRIATQIATGQQEPAPFPPPAAAPPPPGAHPPAAGYPPPAGYPPGAPGTYPPGAAPPGAPGMPPGFSPTAGAPGMPPGAGFTPPPVQSSGGSGKRIGVSIISVIAAIAILLGGKAISGAVRKEMRGGSISSGGSGSSDETPSSTVSDGPAASPSAPQTAVVKSLPKLCGTLDSVLPAKVDGIELDNDTSDPERRFCRWQRINNRNGRDLEITVDTHVNPNSRNPGPQALEEAKRNFGRDWEYAAESKYVKAREKLTGLGDEAFATHHASFIARGPNPDTAHFYWLGGAELEVRKGNVIITIDWRAADNYSSGRSHKGKYLPYKTAKAQATKIARKILTTIE